MTRLSTYAGASEFLREVGTYLERQEVANGLMLGLAARLAEDPLAYGNPPYFASVAGARGPLLAALMTSPFNLILYSEHPDRESTQAAVELAARDLIKSGRQVAGTVGPAFLTEAFADVWTRLTGAGSAPGMSQRLYKLTEVIHPRYSHGRLRQAEDRDAGRILEWMRAFEREEMRTATQTSPDMVRSRIAEGSAFLWDDRGPVCMAMKTRPTRHGVSVSWVYTPPARRRRGYATSCAAALSQRLLDSGFEFCTLFTDLENPTSNHIYQQIGYRHVCDFREIKFT
jgi:predicted GNAT family acetyltransferase